MKNHKEIMNSEKFKIACDGLFSVMRIKNTKLLNLSLKNEVNNDNRK